MLRSGGAAVSSRIPLLLLAGRTHYHWNHPLGSCGSIQPLLSQNSWSWPALTLYLFVGML